MPYQARFNYEDDPNNPKNISGESGAASVGIPGQESSKPQKGSGQYANIQSYLSANKDQGDQMGQKVAGQVEDSAKDAQSKIGGLSAPNIQAYDPNEAYSSVRNLSADQKNQYTQAKQGYQGPQSVSEVQGYNDAAKAKDQAAQKVSSAGNEYGQQQLLKDTYNRPKYSAGENRLDQVLLQNSTGSRSKLEDLSQRYSGLNDLFNQKQEQLGSQIQSSKQQAGKNQQAIQQGEELQWNSLLNPIQQRAQQANIDNPALYDRVSQDASDEILSDETLSRLGLNEGERLFDLNLSSYLNPNLQQVNAGNVASADERAMAQALASLTGRDDVDLSGEAINPVGFNKEQFSQDLAGRLAAFNGDAMGRNFESLYRDDVGRVLNRGSVNAARFLNENPNFNLNQNALDWNYGDITDEAPWYNQEGNMVTREVESPFGPYGESKLLPVGNKLPGESDPRTQAANISIKNDLYNQLKDYLNSQNYNRVIKKG